MFDLMFILVPILVSIGFLVSIVFIIVNSIKNYGKKETDEVDNKNSNAIFTDMTEKEIAEKIKNNQIDAVKKEKYCEYCGSQLKENETKCSSCGAKIVKKKEK